MAEFHIIYFGLAFLTVFNLLLGILSLNFFLKNKHAKKVLQDEKDSLIKLQQEFGMVYKQLRSLDKSRFIKHSNKSLFSQHLPSDN